MSNFAFLHSDFRAIAESASRAEAHIMGDPRAACFHARFTLEAIVHWLYRHDNSLQMPYSHKLGALIHDPGFQNLLPEAVFQKARVIHQMGNQAVHSRRTVQQYDALQVVKELFHLSFWLVRTYAPAVPLEKVKWHDEDIPRPKAGAEHVSRKELEALEAQLAEQNEAALKRQQEWDELDAELQELRRELTRVRQEADRQPDLHDYSEEFTRSYLIDVDLKRAGWPLDQERDREYPVTGMPNSRGVGYADYVLWGDDGKPLAVVEAKKSTIDPDTGRQQAKLYADCLEAMHGQRPIIFYTNGYETWMWDDRSYPPRQVAGFYKKDELNRLIRRREQRTPLDVTAVRDEIVERYYQKRAIGSVFEQFTAARRKALLVMATGTGKTRTAIALVDVLQRSGWVKRALFLADRVSLVRQAVNAFKIHLPESSPVNLVTEKDAEGRVHVCTYPTMMGLIDESKGSEARFGIGHFDLVIIDEAHRSVYQKYGAIFRYFDSLLIGLTATPREQVDRNTYTLFDLEPGVPTDAYELSEAVSDGFLVPPRAEQVDLRFPREGIDYNQLSDEEKEQWESLDWGDEADEGSVPDRVNASAINNWLFNNTTVDTVLQHLMEHGHRVECGDRLAKTIIFARNHEHAVFIEERFNYHFPHYKGHFARVIDNRVKYPQSLIDDFSQKEKDPHIAISVDMLDTGIDVPEVANLVFFKPVYSKIKFWQMIGRGTRLCPDLFGPGEDKEDFRVFDFCFNFDFFRENPDGIESSGAVSLGTRLFCARVELLDRVQHQPELDEGAQLHRSIVDELHGDVAAMNTGNFMVRMHRKAVERFRERAAWEALSDDDRATLQREIAPLPVEKEQEEIESRLFDLTSLRMQLALADQNAAAFEQLRQRLVDIAMMLEEKAAIPAVRQQLAYLAALQEQGFWDGIDLQALEEMRLKLRVLVPLLDKKKRTIVYTDFQDEVVSIREEDPLPLPTMTNVQYEKKVQEYLKAHRNDLVIHRLRTNQPLTPRDLRILEKKLVDIGEDSGETLLSELLQRSGSPSLVHFIRSMVGLDRSAAQQAFSRFLSDRSLTARQIRFIELIIDQLTARGVMDSSALYEPPFSHMHSGGPDELFAGKDAVVNEIFSILHEFTPSVEGEL
ncbi:DEAD/DEAH box helicase family protein [Prosthecochloris sp. N3]|uniref:DEAD/DEAH box helicase family protein n=1 Tax=Prosthecochloris ethylica TaxID=2743976 RepID=A0ABR9XSF0_9CHLB|nr:DEAD/DEAH box helicase family protein [Prosthecochloris ethylica]MBF0585318.1 DEAD/DEAH box helicase family protein [Prosthecochloris ethylica]MBF0636854.1 DEAD/DEAH box helicase family protein [Prosthecochloris ethylica]NUK46547.1 DEAD/DEAH box helicase family protein [Prosthecochloris ethylica]